MLSRRADTVVCWAPTGTKGACAPPWESGGGLSSKERARLSRHFLDGRGWFRTSDLSRVKRRR